MGWKEFLITRIAGKFMIVTGIATAFLILMYDFIVQRRFDLGYWQMVGIGWHLSQACLGYLLDDFTRDL